MNRSITSHAKVALPGSQRQALPGSSKVAAIAGGEIVQVTVVLRRRTASHPPQAKDFAFADGGTIAYHSRSEFGTLHGAEPRDIEMVLEMAHEYGLTVAETNAAARTVALTAPASAMQEALGSPLAWYDSPHGRYRGRTGSIMVREPLQTRIMAVLGLDNRPVAKPHLRRRAAAAGPAGSFTPPELAGFYNFPTGVNGSGQTIAIIELGGGYRAADLKTYFKGLGLKVPAVTAVSVDGGHNSPGTDPNSDGEVMLDIEVAGAVAPGARIVVYFAPNTDQGFHDAVSKAVHDTVNKPSVISISWGGSEDDWTLQARTAMEAAMEDAAAVGVTVTVAAGDDGASDGATSGFHVDFPAALPEVLGCGGTKAVRTGTTIAETVWNELAKQEGATGGGVSRIYPVPAYQATANVPPQTDTNFKGRGVPDVAGDADPETGYQVRVDGQNTVIGGTSAVAPLWAGLIACINQRLARPVGFVNPMLYQIGTSAFVDITTGDNGGYGARAGWDPCTGLGSPNGTALVKALLGVATATA